MTVFNSRDDRSLVRGRGPRNSGRGFGPPSQGSASGISLTFATWNPSDIGANLALSNGNLTLKKTPAGGAWTSVRANQGKSSGKWYAFEITISSNSNQLSGIVTAASSLATYMGGTVTSWSYVYDGNKYNNNASQAYGNTFTTNDVIGCAIDLDNGKVWWSKNNVWQNSGDPAAGTNAAFTGLSGTFYPAISLFTLNDQVTANFGASAFSGSPPAGFNVGWYS